MKRWLVPVLIVLIVAAGVGGFFGGRATAGDSTESAQMGPEGIGDMQGDGTLPDGSTMPSGGAMPSGAAGRAGAGLTAGSIVSKDDTSITIQLADGNTQIVYFSDSTTISETKESTSDSLAEGEDVTVMGSSNSDGSLTASTIQVGAALGGMFGGEGAAPGDGTAPGAGGTTGDTGVEAEDTTATTAD
jgi:hypothetical protein